MKKIFVCEYCGMQFEKQEDCKNHEKKCSKTGALEKRIAALEKKVEELEMWQTIFRKYDDQKLTWPSAPYYPPTTPPTNPLEQPHPWWNPCTPWISPFTCRDAQNTESKPQPSRPGENGKIEVVYTSAKQDEVC